MDHLNTMKASSSGREINHNDTPNIFSLLDYEDGLLLSSSIDGNTFIPQLIDDYLKQKSIESLRGILSFNDLNESQENTYKLRKFNFNNIKYHNTELEIIDTSFTKGLYKKFESLPDDSGWRNPYICT